MNQYSPHHQHLAWSLDHTCCDPSTVEAVKNDYFDDPRL